MPSKRYDRTFNVLISNKKRDYIFLDTSMVKILIFKTFTSKKDIHVGLETKIGKVFTKIFTRFSLAKSSKIPFRTLAYINGIRLFAKTKNAYIYVIHLLGGKNLHARIYTSSVHKWLKSLFPSMFCPPLTPNRILPLMLQGCLMI